MGHPERVVVVVREEKVEEAAAVAMAAKDADVMASATTAAVLEMDKVDVEEEV